MRILIVGTGQVGYFLCERLSEEGHEVTLIDNDPEHLNRAQERLNVLGILGNGASAEILEQGGIKAADIFIAVTDMDEVNILACLLAREYGVGRRIARVRSIEYSGRGAVLSKEKLGIDLLINPKDAVAEEMIKIASRQGAFDVAEFVEGQIQFIGYRIGDKSPLCDLTLKELGEIRGMYRFVVTAVTRGEKTIIPRGDDTIRAGDSIFIFAHHNDLPAIQYLLQPEPEKACRLRRAFILGGGGIGLQIAQRLEQLHFNVRLIERDEKRCEFLASKLRKSMIIHTDGTDIRTLSDEGIEGADVFMAVTGNDEDNILCSLLAKKHGAKRALVLVNKPEYLNLAPSLGIDACVSPRLAAGAVILKHVRRGKVLSLATVEGSNAEVLELQIGEDSRILDHPLKSLHFPRGAIIGAIVRDREYLIPTGETVLRPLDRVVVFALPEALHKVERFFE
ncbi:Trk system potassium transporter TrkA [Geoalkalibacter halelectricus]|uniref:Trk system potassium uptake protein TrkA n=1 Tax=Geoalkalibacter halelectricus TaxID=2847045 RepID=A0ABY5ZRZ2_9BACT|nr:Trk system potassium transporter TrkA [Geoalkalibacter halelectricus]MDO3377607.1 Trk system potassium transporter TrkA [Geoalkalibacter halelectricus]UWZ81398.1 Trk system potassium transporter TrkA [Geoalkalibacter halelectricus]